MRRLRTPQATGCVPSPLSSFSPSHSLLFLSFLSLSLFLAQTANPTLYCVSFHNMQLLHYIHAYLFPFHFFAVWGTLRGSFWHSCWSSWQEGWGRHGHWGVYIFHFLLKCVVYLSSFCKAWWHSIETVSVCLSFPVSLLQGVDPSAADFGIVAGLGDEEADALATEELGNEVCILFNYAINHSISLSLFYLLSSFYCLSISLISLPFSVLPSPSLSYLFLYVCLLFSASHLQGDNPSEAVVGILADLDGEHNDDTMGTMVSSLLIFCAFI